MHDFPIHKRSGAYLPHWTQEHGIYAVRFRLADSVPQEKLKQWQWERAEISDAAKTQKRDMTVQERLQFFRLHTDTVEQYLRNGHGACWLKEEQVATIVARALQHFDGKRYCLFAWCIMPNHIHAVVQPFPEWELSAILHSWKTFTANKANRILGRKGSFWQRESFDRLLRSEDQVRYHIEYTWGNPEFAGLREWKWRWKLEEPKLKGILEDWKSKSVRAP